MQLLPGTKHPETKATLCMSTHLLTYIHPGDEALHDMLQDVSSLTHTWLHQAARLQAHGALFVTEE